MECRLRQTLPIPNQAGEANTVIFGDVLCFHVDEAVLMESGSGCKIDPEKLRAIGRMGGPTYTRTRDRFDMVRPR
jgi:flavin reductase (DIM6/NTAB) family NADH-FMN oxidoreductase RutF